MLYEIALQGVRGAYRVRVNFAALSGLGDAVYAFPVVEAAAKIAPVNVSTQYPEVFLHLNNVTCTTGTLSNETRLAYNRHGVAPYWDEVRRAAGLSDLSFYFQYPLSPVSPLVGAIIGAAAESGKKLCILAEPRAAHMHKAQCVLSMAPGIAETVEWVTANRQRFFFVAVGQHEVFKTRLPADFDAVDKLTVTEYLQLCAHADAFATQIGHLVPIAQGLRKPLKIFPPEKNNDPRTARVTVERVRIKGIDNETI